MWPLKCGIQEGESTSVGAGSQEISLFSHIPRYSNQVLDVSHR